MGQRMFVTALALTALAGKVGAQDAPLLIAGPEAELGIWPEDVTAVTLAEVAGQPVVRVELDETASDRLATLTEGQVGVQMVFRFCGEEILRPRLRSTLANGQFTLGGPLGDRAAEVVAILEGRHACMALTS